MVGVGMVGGVGVALRLRIPTPPHPIMPMYDQWLQKGRHVRVCRQGGRILVRRAARVQGEGQAGRERCAQRVLGGLVAQEGGQRVQGQGHVQQVVLVRLVGVVGRGGAGAGGRGAPQGGRQEAAPVGVGCFTRAAAADNAANAAAAAAARHPGHAARGRGPFAQGASGRAHAAHGGGRVLVRGGGRGGTGTGRMKGW
jgi:hypothetical protein